MSRKCIVVAGMLATLLAVVTSSAAADGPCGQNYDTSHACAVNSPASMSGSLVMSGEVDHYVFYATAGAQVQVSLTDNEDPSCASGAGSTDCGYVYADLFGPDGSSSGPIAAASASANPTSSQAVALNETGTYDLQVTGLLTYDFTTSSYLPLPYTLGITATPNVQWPPSPPPPPPATVHCSSPSGMANDPGVPMGNIIGHHMFCNQVKRAIRYGYLRGREGHLRFTTSGFRCRVLRKSVIGRNTPHPLTTGENIGCHNASQSFRFSWAT